MQKQTVHTSYLHLCLKNFLEFISLTVLRECSTRHFIFQSGQSQAKTAYRVIETKKYKNGSRTLGWQSIFLQTNFLLIQEKLKLNWLLLH